jgi:Na+-driven multidrug efflux pump
MVLSKPFGVKGVWLAITVDLFFRFSLSLWRYLPGNWYKKPRLYTEGNAV